MQPVTLTELKELSLFSGLPENALQWLIDNGTLLEINADETAFKSGNPVDHMYIILAGELRFMRQIGGQMLPVFQQEKGGIAGLLPYSRMKSSIADAVAMHHTRLLSIHRDLFPQMERESSEMVQRLVALMTERVREATKTQDQFEKMAALGKLSAGLAHELNNPAAAIVRTAADLGKQLTKIPELLALFSGQSFSTQQVETIKLLLTKRTEANGKKLSIVEKSEREDQLIDWLEDHGVAESFDQAEAFLQAGITPADLEPLAAIPPDALPAVLTFVERMLSTTQLAKEIEEASKRISALVGSVKSYSHMDRAREKEPTDVREGINNTLVMLGHAVKEKNIRIRTEYQEDLPAINAFGSELNQIWTNLIDNAVDAMDTGGELRLTAKNSGNGKFVEVRVIDNGKGIPKDIQTKIFDPFFTTKDVGKGTGLGLDIVQRIVRLHNGSIKVESQPGNTAFIVCLPVE